MTFKKTLFIFRRDLRFADNTGLLAACRNSEQVLPVFIFDPQQIREHAYRSDSGLLFMLNSLSDLQQQLREQGGELCLLWGEPVTLVEKILKEHGIEAVFVNRDYSPFSIKRDRELAACCTRNQAQWVSADDALLNAPEQILKADRSPYVVYTAYYKAAIKAQTPALPCYERHANFTKIDFNDRIELEDSRLAINASFDLNPKGGRREALEILKRLAKLDNYKETRDYPALDSTTRLSAHNKFGTVSVREVYHQVARVLERDHTLIRELYWRDFFTQIAFHFPHVFQGAFHRVYDKVQWEFNELNWQAWCKGMTGFPIVDAGMRELNQTGFMHNRVRMIVASFLTKDLHISWREGERYFARKLVDYDPAVNNGNWQWAASTGCDAQPYFRIFNPWLQQKRFDLEAKYIKRWVPELEKLAPNKIHDSEATEARLAHGYLAPVVEHDLERDHTLDLYSHARNLAKQP